MHNDMKIDATASQRAQDLKQLHMVAYARGKETSLSGIILRIVTAVSGIFLAMAAAVSQPLPLALLSIAVIFVVSGIIIRNAEEIVSAFDRHVLVFARRRSHYSPVGTTHHVVVHKQPEPTSSWWSWPSFGGGKSVPKQQPSNMASMQKKSTGSKQTTFGMGHEDQTNIGSSYNVGFGGGHEKQTTVGNTGNVGFGGGHEKQTTVGNTGNVGFGGGHEKRDQTQPGGNVGFGSGVGRKT